MDCSGEGPRPRERPTRQLIGPWWRQRRAFLVDRHLQFRLVGQALTILLLGAVLALANAHVFNQLAEAYDARLAPAGWSTHLLVVAYSAASVLVSAAIVLIICVVYSHRTAGPASKLVARLEQMADGDLRGGVELRSSDHLGHVADAVNHLKRRWNASVTEVLHATEVLRNHRGSLDHALLEAQCAAIEAALERYKNEADQSAAAS